MINPTHLIKQFPNGFNHKIPYINSRDELVWITHHERGWLGSGVTDCNGNEIFEGDILAGGQKVFRVVFDDGRFRLWTDSRPDWWWHLISLAGALEIVGHIATEESNVSQ